MGRGEDARSVVPDDPLLAQAAAAVEESGQWGVVVDADWQVVFISEEVRMSFGWDPALPTTYYGAAWVEELLGSQVGPNTIELARQAVSGGSGRVMLTDLGHAEVEARVDPRLVDVFKRLHPVDGPMITSTSTGVGVDGQPVAGVSTTVSRIRAETGRLAGNCITFRPAASASTLAFLAIHSDLGHLERMMRVAEPSRRPTAVLFADLEGSSPLARRLSTAAYFKLAQRLVRAADNCVIDAGGLVGRHVGDGVAAFFVADDAGSESAAVRACIDAARAIRIRLPDIARDSDLDVDDVVVRIGLHWGGTLIVGNITSRGRSEVTALGAEVNEAARIEACATGGRILASKDVIERLDPADAAALDINPEQILYTSLADLPQATEKARRDAPAIAVCEI